MKKQFILISLTILIIVGGYLIINLHQEVESQVIEQLLSKQEIYAKQAAKSIESFFENFENSLTFLSRNKSIINADNDLSTQLKNFYDANKLEIKGVTRISKEGVIIDTYPKVDNVLGRDVSYQKHNAEIIKTQKPVISDVLRTVQGYKAIIYAYPVFKNGKYDGCISLVVSFEYIAEKFLEIIKIGKTGYAVVLSANGIELFCSIKEHIGKSIINDSKKDPNLEQMVKNMLKGKSGRAFYTYDWNGIEYSEGVEKHAVYQSVNIGNTFWSIAVTVSRDEVLAINRGFIYKLISISTIVVVLLGLISYIYYRFRSHSIKLLKQNEEQYRTVIEQTGQIIYELDFNTSKIVWRGAVEEITGYTSDQFGKFSFEDCVNLVHPDDREKQLNLLEEAKNKLSKYNGVYRSLTNSGNYIYVENNGVFVKKGKPANIHMYGAIKNITEKKEAELALREYHTELENTVKIRTAELNDANKNLKEDIVRREKVEEALKDAIDKVERSERIKTEFLAQMSHEIRTPVNTLLSFSSLMREELEHQISEELKYGFTGMKAAGTRIIRTIDLILNMSQLQTDTYEYNPKKINICDDIIKKLIAEYKSIASEKEIDFILSQKTHFVDVVADEYTVTQIFANLIDNAIKYTNKGSIEVKVFNSENGSLNISVIDTGIGIKEEYIPYLFDAFTQEEGGYTRKFEGNGLGLALVKKYCELNNAMISVKSTKGKGSEFTIAFHIR